MSMTANMMELDLDQLSMVAGGDYTDRLLEIRAAVMDNRYMKECYYEVLRSEEFEDDEEILAEVLAQCCAIKVTFVNGDMLYWDGNWSHQEVMSILRSKKKCM